MLASNIIVQCILKVSIPILFVKKQTYIPLTLKCWLIWPHYNYFGITKHIYFFIQNHFKWFTELKYSCECVVWLCICFCFDVVNFLCSIGNHITNIFNGLKTICQPGKLRDVSTKVNNFDHLKNVCLIFSKLTVDIYSHITYLDIKEPELW